jgi:hypothetical protein
MKRLLILPTLTLLAIGLSPASASADITAFLSVSPTPANHAGSGVAVGMGLVVVGFEFEYSALAKNDATGVPGLKCGMGNVLVQTPTKKLQFYATTGGGAYSESQGSTSTTGFGTNVGGGAKIGLVGPLRLRVDYRVYQLQGGATYKNPKRFYVGLNLSL